MRARFVMLAVAALAAATLTGVSTPAQGAPPQGANLVVNAGLEAGAAWPECFSASGWGTEGVWSAVPGHTGSRAVSVTIGGYVAGDRKLLQTESPACAPQVDPGATYELSVWYRSDVPVHLTVFRHTESGWSYWGDLRTFAPAAAWTMAIASSPPIPSDTDQLTFGLSLAGNGTLVTDDYSLVRETVPEPPASGNLVANPLLMDGSPVPDCFLAAGWGDNVVQQEFSSDVPSGAPDGTRSYSMTMSSRASGDAKLIQSEATGCAPAVNDGEVYSIAIDYTSTSAANAVTVFSHTSTGWGYWTDVAALPPTSQWSTASAELPPIPAGVDRISFGISIAAVGTLRTTNYRLAVPEDPPPPDDPPPGDPATVGSWTVLGSEMPIRTIHTTLLSDGRLLLIAGSGADGKQFAAGTFRAVVWDPDDDSFTEIPVPYDMFCAGHLTLPDGKVLLAGGTAAFPSEAQGPNTFKGSNKSYYFDPAHNLFHPLANMAGAHWYPTLTKLGNGDVWAAGGLNENAEGTVLTEMFDVSAMRWLPPNEVPQTWSFWGTYPHMYLLDDGLLFYAGAHTFGNGLPGTGASLYDWTTATIWDVPGLREKDLRDQAGSVLLPPAQDQRVMIVGGGNTDGVYAATDLVDIIDLSAPSPQYVPGPDLPGPGKGYVNVLNLPDRSVLAANGAQYNRSGDVLTAAIYDPATNAWTSVAADPIGRNYHSTAILLPDGRVAVMGSNPADNSFELRISVYSPPYLFAGPRPTATGVPTQAHYGDSISIDVTGNVVSASLIPPMSATHQTDTNARLVDLPIAGTGTARTVQIPANANLLPPGPYMLNVLDSAGVPSVATWVWIS